jgi:exosortase/archaeosortase family protein
MTVVHKSIGSLWKVLLFVAIFGVLQFAWSVLHQGVIGQIVVEGLTVKTAVALINLITPSVAAVAQGTHISAPGGGINVISGCEGIEVMLLLAAAMSIAPLTWRARLIGLLVGSIVVFLLNQVRLIAMFYAVRIDRSMFDMLHGMVAPILLIALTSLFFSWWLGRHGVDRATDIHAS